MRKELKKVLYDFARDSESASCGNEIVLFEFNVKNYGRSN